jgi:glyoxylase-like metal-dependent hydrolase (beta-lactamase superfamily II)
VSDCLTRRDLLVAAATAACLALPAADAATPAPALAPLGEGLWLVQGAAAPVVIADSGRELLLVDGGDAKGLPALRSLLVRAFPGRRISTLFNTHWHGDRTGANEALAKVGATVIAHENTRLWLGTEVRDRWEGRVHAPLPAKALPNLTFFQGSKTLEFGGQLLEYGYLPQAHTDGDLYVHFPRQDVIVAGGVVAGDGYPELDAATNGWLGGMLSGLKTLMARSGEGTRVIGSQAVAVGRAQMRAQQELCFDLLTRIGQSYYKGETWEQFRASAPTKDYDARLGDPARFLRAAYDSAWLHVNEIRRPGRQEWIG